MSSARDRNTRSSYGLHVARAHYSNTGGSSQWEVNLNFWRLRLDRKFGVVMEGHRSGMRSTQRSTLEVSVSQRPKRYSPTAPTHAVGRQPLGLQLDRDRSKGTRGNTPASLLTGPTVQCLFPSSSQTKATWGWLSGVIGERMLRVRYGTVERV